MLRLLYLCFFITLSTYGYCQSPCETITQASLQRLPELLKKNDFEKIQTVCNTIQSSCPQSELAWRLEILIQIIQKQNANPAIKTYLDHQMEIVLITRYDDAADQNREQRYSLNPEKYEYFPLNSPVDLLIQTKAKALLNSNSYTLNKEEVAILYLFADNIEAFYDTL